MGENLPFLLLIVGFENLGQCSRQGYVIRRFHMQHPQTMMAPPSTGHLIPSGNMGLLDALCLSSGAEVNRGIYGMQRVTMRQSNWPANNSKQAPTTREPNEEVPHFCQEGNTNRLGRRFGPSVILDQMQLACLLGLSIREVQTCITKLVLCLIPSKVESNGCYGFPSRQRHMDCLTHGSHGIATMAILLDLLLVPIIRLMTAKLILRVLMIPPILIIGSRQYIVQKAPRASVLPILALPVGLTLRQQVLSQTEMQAVDCQ